MATRLEIRSAIRDLIATAQADADNWPQIAQVKQLETSRYIPLQDREKFFPAVLVYAEGEEIGQGARHNVTGFKARTLEIAIELRGRGASAEDPLEQLADEIEALLDQHLTLPGDIVSSVMLQSVSFDGVGDGAVVYHLGKMAYRVEYDTELAGWIDQFNE